MNTLTLPLFNRDFRLPPDGKVQVVPMGEYPVVHDGKTLVQVIDAAACRAMVESLRADAADQNFGGLCMDFDHFRHDPEKESRAAAWIMNVEARADGLYAAPRWTTSGQAAVEGGDWRFLSPEFDPASLEPLGGKRYRVTRLVGFGLTNSPNMRGMPALTNRAGTATGGRATAVASIVGDMQARQTVLANRAVASAAEHGSKDNAAAVAALAKQLRAQNPRLTLSSSYDSARFKLGIG